MQWNFDLFFLFFSLVFYLSCVKQMKSKKKEKNSLDDKKKEDSNQNNQIEQKEN